MKLDITIYKPRARWWEIAGIVAAAALVLLSEPIGEWLDERFPL